MGILNRLDWRDKKILTLLITIPIAASTATRLAYHLLSQAKQEPEIYRSPLHTQPRTLSSNHPYPPTALPGARDIPTPYGSQRAYEFGPETGRKILLIHGISTPCVSLASLAHVLANEYHCRVCLFDLPGRGYSDCPDPETMPQNLNFFSNVIFHVLASSPCPTGWLGDERFTLVGYSLGGGIAAGFASWFPRLVGGLVLLAPSGVMRPSRIGTGSKFLYSGLLPTGLVGWLVARRLRGGGSSTSEEKGKAGNPEATTGPAKAAVGEMPKGNEEEGAVGHPALARDSEASLFPHRPGISVANAVAWQLEEHPGFVPAFVSGIQNAPIMEQHGRWKIVGERQKVGRRASADEEAKAMALREKRVLVLLGETDGVVVKDETSEDVKSAFGEENVHVDVLEGGHDVPIVNAKACADAIFAFRERSESGL
ncbi:hypothetical protein MBLNU230_g2401t1 [Neophaeotheca triangularis]